MPFSLVGVVKADHLDDSASLIIRLGEHQFKFCRCGQAFLLRYGEGCLLDDRCFHQFAAMDTALVFLETGRFNMDDEGFARLHFVPFLSLDGHRDDVCLHGDVVAHDLRLYRLVAGDLRDNALAGGRRKHGPGGEHDAAQLVLGAQRPGILAVGQKHPERNAQEGRSGKQVDGDKLDFHGRTVLTSRI